MGYERALSAEIDAELDRLQAAKQRMVADWIANTIVKRHMGNLPNDEEREFWRYCGYATVRDRVRRRINIRVGEPNSEDQRQRVLPGHEFVQEYYLVPRGRKGEQIAVHVNRMTRTEVAWKVQQLRTMGDGCHRHADELQAHYSRRRGSRSSND